jgi:hypothetical protein
MTGLSVITDPEAERPHKAAAAQIGKAPPGRHYPVYISAWKSVRSTHGVIKADISAAVVSIYLKYTETRVLIKKGGRFYLPKQVETTVH